MKLANELSRRQLLAGSRLGIIPVGAFEVHNEDLPLGTDTFIAEAAATLVCEKGDAVLLPPVSYTYAGVTATMAGTISVDLSAMTDYLVALFGGTLRTGLGPLVIVSAHGGNDLPCINALERVFHQSPAGLLYCNILGQGYIDLMAEVWGAAPDTALAENLSLWAAWEMQGRPAVQRPPAPANQEGSPQRIRRMARAGHVPHTYTRPDQHIVMKDEGTVSQGRMFLESAADRIVSVLDELRGYHDELTNR